MDLSDTSRIVGQAVMILVPMVLSLTVHEFSHALVATRLGDPTAKAANRLNLNPLSHADPLGTFLLPLLILVASGAGLNAPFFGWAKPVPFNPARFTRKLSMRTGTMLVSFAGPLSNLTLAFLSAALISALVHGGAYAQLPEAGKVFLAQMLGINVALFVFNMVPVYPLDGQKVLSGLLPYEAALRFERLNYQFGSLALMALVIFAGKVMAYPIALVALGIQTAVGLG